MTQTIFNILITIILFLALIVFILGTLFIIQTLMIELFDYDVLKWIKERIRNHGNK